MVVEVEVTKRLVLGEQKYYENESIGADCTKTNPGARLGPSVFGTPGSVLEPTTS